MHFLIFYIYIFHFKRERWREMARACLTHMTCAHHHHTWRDSQAPWPGCGLQWKKCFDRMEILPLYQAEKGNNPTVKCKLCLPTVKLLSSSKDSTSNLKKHSQVRPIILASYLANLILLLLLPLKNTLRLCVVMMTWSFGLGGICFVKQQLWFAGVLSIFAAL